MPRLPLVPVVSLSAEDLTSSFSGGTEASAHQLPSSPHCVCTAVYRQRFFLPLQSYPALVLLMPSLIYIPLLGNHSI